MPTSGQESPRRDGKQSDSCNRAGAPPQWAKDCYTLKINQMATEIFPQTGEVCWFCKRNPHCKESGVPHLFYMESLVPTVAFGRAHKIIVAVPRCARCRRAHSRSKYWGLAFSMLFLVSTLLLWGLQPHLSVRFSSRAVLPFSLLGVLIGSLVSFLVGKRFGLMVKQTLPYSESEYWPGLREWSAKGWLDGGHL